MAPLANLVGTVQRSVVANFRYLAHRPGERAPCTGQLWRGSGTGVGTLGRGLEHGCMHLAAGAQYGAWAAHRVCLPPGMPVMVWAAGGMLKHPRHVWPGQWWLLPASLAPPAGRRACARSAAHRAVPCRAAPTSQYLAAVARGAGQQVYQILQGYTESARRLARPPAPASKQHGRPNAALRAKEPAQPLRCIARAMERAPWSLLPRCGLSPARGPWSSRPPSRARPPASALEFGQRVLQAVSLGRRVPWSRGRRTRVALFTLRAVRPRSPACFEAMTASLTSLRPGKRQHDITPAAPPPSGRTFP